MVQCKEWIYFQQGDDTKEEGFVYQTTITITPGSTFHKVDGNTIGFDVVNKETPAEAANVIGPGRIQVPGGQYEASYSL